LRHVTFYTGPGVDKAAFAQIISALPTSLESMDVGSHDDDAEPVKDALSSFFCRCGPSLRSLGTRSPLSDTATLHLMQLPNLSRWKTDQGPPQATSASIPQSLEHFEFDGGGALPWLRFLASGGEGIGERLKSLDLPDCTVIDLTFLSPAVSLRNLVNLRVFNYSCKAMDSCLFRLTDGGMEDLAAALPRLKCLWLGNACRLDTCKTTVASLMSLSIHCPNLLLLGTHFNTRTIVEYMQGLLDGGVGHDRAKCQLRSIFVGDIPLRLDSADLQTVAMGFSLIFPHMTQLVGSNGHWSELGRRMRGVGGDYSKAKAVVP